MDYNINYDDARFQAIENEKNDAINKSNTQYDDMVDQSDDFYQKQIDANNNYKKEQEDIQNQQTGLAIEKIENEKKKTQEDYEREQRGAYTDYQEAINQYGSNAERMASNGIGANSGVSESARIASWSAYQNRYSTARQTYNQAVTDYNLAIKDAQLQNSAALAEIAYNTLQANLQLGLQGFQYKNTLLQQKLQNEQTLNSEYYGRWKDVLSQMNTENALAEEARQYNEKMAYQRERDAVSDAQWQKEYELSKKKVNSSGGGTSNPYSYEKESDDDSSVNLNNVMSALESAAGTSSLSTLKNLVNTYYNNGVLSANEKDSMLTYVEKLYNQNKSNSSNKTTTTSKSSGGGSGTSFASNKTSTTSKVTSAAKSALSTIKKLISK